MNQAAMRAATDQTLAGLATERADPPPQLVGQLNMAAKVAGLLTEEFGDDAPLAGRVAVAAARHLHAVLIAAHTGGLPKRNAPLLVNVLAHAGGMLAGQSSTGGTE